MKIGDPVYHLISVWVERGSPMTSWSMYDSEWDSYKAAAASLECKQIKGFFLGWNKLGGDAEVTDYYLPSGGPDRFKMVDAGGYFTLTFDEVSIL